MTEAHEYKEKRKMALTPADIEAIAQAVHKLQLDDDHHCRFGQLDPKQVASAMEFFVKFNAAMEDSKKTVRRWLIIAFLTALAGLVGMGFWEKVKAIAKL